MVVGGGRCLEVFSIPSSIFCHFLINFICLRYCALELPLYARDGFGPGACLASHASSTSTHGSRLTPGHRWLIPLFTFCPSIRVGTPGCQTVYMDHTGCHQWCFDCKGCHSRVSDWLHGPYRVSSSASEPCFGCTITWRRVPTLPSKHPLCCGVTTRTDPRPASWPST